MKKRYLALFILISFIFSTCAAIGGGIVGVLIAGNSSELAHSIGLPPSELTVNLYDENSPIIDVAESASPAVVSIVISAERPVYQESMDSFFGIPNRRQVGTEERQIGSGSGFVISESGLIITNKHVVDNTEANYTVVLSDGTEIAAEVVGRDPLLDIAVVKIDPDGHELHSLSVGDSDNIKVGQSVVAIGNSLGRFSNTVSSGIISGLGRSIVASDGVSFSETLEGVIQTDASINPGNSGGPLLDLAGNVIGVNVAIADDAENVGFAIPINLVLPVIDSVREFGEIRRPLLGVRYQEVTPALAEEFDLPVEYGARIITGPNGEPAIAKDSSADEAGLQTEDIILEINGKKLDTVSLRSEIQKYGVDDEIELKYLRNGKEQTVTVKLKAVTVE